MLEESDIAFVDRHLQGAVDGTLPAVPPTNGDNFVGILASNATVPTTGDGDLRSAGTGEIQVHAAGTVQLDTATFFDPVTIAGGAINDKSGTDITAADDQNVQANTTAVHTYADGPATQTHEVRVTDEDGIFLAGSLNVDVLNVAPTLVLSGPTSANEGETKSYSFTVSDPGDDAFTLISQSCGDNGDLSSATFDGVSRAGSFDYRLAAREEITGQSLAYASSYDSS